MERIGIIFVTFRFSRIYRIVLLCLLLQLLTACHQAEVPESNAAASKPVPRTRDASDTVNLNAEAAKIAQVEILLVAGRQGNSEIKTTGEIKADEGRVFHINSIVAGRVVKDNVSLGQMIKAGQVLAVVQNLEVSKVYGEYIHEAHQNEIAVKETTEKLDLYHKTLDRAKKMFDEGIGAQKDVIQAQSQVNIAEIELNGQKEHSIHIKSEAAALLSAYGVKLGENADKDAHFVETGSPLRSPRSGVVIQKNITMGDVVTAEQPLYVVADLSKIWLDVSVYDKDLDAITTGQTVLFTSDSLPKRKFEGIISYIPPSANNMRVFTARAVLPNVSPICLIAPFKNSATRFLHLS
jgi:cobalt-zinc-cadmium efflux system membrane fusion protein